MSIRKRDALACELVDIGRGNLRVLVVAADVSIAKIVGEDHYYVRPLQVCSGTLSNKKAASSYARETAFEKLSSVHLSCAPG